MFRFLQLSFARPFLCTVLSLLISPAGQLLAQAGPAPVTLATTTAPTAAEAGVTPVNLTGSGFPSGQIDPGAVQVTLQPRAPGSAPAMVANVSSIVAVIGSTRRVTFTASPLVPNNNVPAPTAYVVSLSGVTTGGVTFASSNTSALTINPPATISLNPFGGTPGQSLTVAIAGTFSAFFQGATQALFGPGISVGGAAAGGYGPVNVTSATTATAQVVIDPAAGAFSRDVSVKTGAEIATLRNGFTVTNGTPVLTTVNPNTGHQGQANESVSLAGQFTHWVQGTSTASFGAGITVATLTVNSATSATAVVNIDPAAAGGARNVSVTTGTEVVTLTNGFTVTPGASILSIVPNNGVQGQVNLPVTITGQNTHFSNASVIDLGSGITVGNVAAADVTHLSAQLTIAGGANLVQNGSLEDLNGAFVNTSANYMALTGGATAIAGWTVTPTTTGSIVWGKSPTTDNHTASSGTFFADLSGFGATSPNGGIQQQLQNLIAGQQYTFSIDTQGPAPLVTVGTATVSLSAGTPFQVGSDTWTPQAGSFIAGSTNPLLTIANQSPGQQVNFIDNIVITGPTTAALGSHNLSVTTGPEVVTLASAFTVNPFPLLLSVTANIGVQGQINVPVTIAGQNTHFATSSVVTIAGTGVTAGVPTAASATSLTVPVTITAGAALGARLVQVVTGGETVSLAGAYTVSAPTPVLSTVNPNTGAQGQQTESVNLSGQFTHWVQGISTASFGAGITVATLTITSATTATVVLNIDPAATTGTRNVSVTTGAEIVTLTNGFTVNSGTPTLTTVNPNTGVQGQQNESVSLTGQFTHWLQGTTTASFGAGITVATLTINSATTATAVINIDPAATAGARNVSVTTGSEIVTLTNGFTVNSGTPMLTTVNPNTGVQGQQNESVSLTGQFTHWLQGTTTASFGAGITVATLTINSATTATAVINIDPAATAGARNVSVTTGSEVVTRNNGFTVNAGTPVLTTVNPSTGVQGQQNESVSLTGQFTNWLQGTTTASFGAGITVATLTINSATTATAVINIDPAATAGARNVSVTTGSEVVTRNNGFTVNAGTPVLTTVNPSTGVQGQQNESVNLTGQFTHWVQGTSTASFGAGITVATLTINSATTATAVLNLDPASATGARNVSVTTGAELVTLINAFTVNAGTAVLTTVNPNTGQQGQTNETVNLAGQFTHWVQGTSTASFGAGITVAALTINSATTATAMLNIAPSAATGARNVSVTTGAEVVTLNNGFTVLTGAASPTISSVSPGSALQGQSIQVLISGQNTHFLQGTTKANFGPGISVNGGIAGAPGVVQVTSPTTATAQISVPATSDTGNRTVVVTTGSEDVSLVNGFAVKRTPYLISVSPASGQKGQALAVVIQAGFTNFQQGITQATFGAGISVGGNASGSAGPITVTSPTTATAQLSIDAAASPGLRNPFVQTGSEQASLPGSGFLVLSTVTGPPPVVNIASPSEGMEITVPTAVTGTITSPNLAAWTLEYQSSGATVFTAFAHGTTATVSGTLDPTLLLNGLAQIRLTAVDLSGQTTSQTLNVVVNRDVKVGNFTLSFLDLTLPLAGLPIQITRTYDSRARSVQDFGFGWAISLKTVKVETNGLLGDNWQGTKSGGFIPNYCVLPTKQVVTVRLPDGAVFQFQPTLGGTACSQLIPPEFVDMSFAPIGSTPANAKLSAPGGAGLFVSGSFPGPIQLLDLDTLELFDPDQFVLTMPDGRQLTLSRTFGLQQVTDRTGITLTFGSNGITSSVGKGVTFTRDAQNRITMITDPNGASLRYGYSPAGDLAAFTDRVGNVTTFGYDGSHHLLSVTNPKGVQAVRNTYDDNGRLLSTTDPTGKTVTYSPDLSARNELITDRLGNSTLFEYNTNGNITRVTDALGAVLAASYDARGNKLTETTALGKTLSYTYDSNNNRLTETDSLGRAFTYTFNTNNQVLTITDPMGHLTTNTYDAAGNLLTLKDALGNVTTMTYNPQGKLLKKTDPLGNTTQFQYDSFGNPTQQIDPLGHVATYTYDANGNRLSQTVTRTNSAGSIENLVTSYLYDAENRLIQTTNPDGSTTKTVYNSLGQPSQTIDPLGHVTQYSYDDSARLVGKIYPDGTSDSFGYDAEGRKISATDRAGRATTYDYDALGRLTRTTYSDGTSLQNVYDLMGQLTQTVDPLGHVTRYAYDDASRRTSVTNALNQVTAFGWDAAGNQISVTDPNNHTVQFVYDPVGRRTRTNYPDGTFETTTYDSNGQTIAKTDQNNKTTQYSYDKLGRLVGVTDALGQVTAYGYDEVGNRISQTDASLRITRYAYDKLGRRTSRVLPLAQSDSSAYDADGNLVSRSDFNGHVTTYAYDSMSRLLSKAADPFFVANHFGAGQIAFAYNAIGKRISMMDASGLSTYSYDSRDRLLQKVSPSGTLSYLYDAGGNLLSVHSANPQGASTTYAYDQLNRLTSASEVTGSTTYSYDAAGNLAGFVYPNGVQTSYTYDALNRLTQMGTIKGGTPLATYSYTLDAVGNRLSAVELSGRTAQYTYDVLYRLTGETIAGAGAQNGSIGYTYDKTGNRLATTSSVAPISPGTLSYDANDRVSADGYDSNGNTVSNQAVSNTYDFEDHMVGHGPVTIVYDGDGNRVAKTVGGVTTHYLVDTNNISGYSQVLEELVSGVVVRSYSFGLQLIAERQTISGSATSSFYGFDGRGSVRSLTNTAGTVTDTYDYDAFGNLLGSTGTTPNNFRFAGEQLDPDLGLYYNRARYLDPRRGRFWTMDPNEGGDVTPASLHKYLYAGANPVTRTDPSGYAYLSNWIFGNIVHNRIGDQYEAATGGCSDTQILRLITGVCDSRIVGLRSPQGARPDLADPFLLGHIYEVKPINSAANGLAEVIWYLGLLKLLDFRVPPAGFRWHLGTAAEFTPASPIPINAVTQAYVAPPVFGVIVYYVVGIDDVVAAAALSAVAIEAALGAGAAAAAGAAEALQSVAALIRLALAASSLELDVDLGAVALEGSLGVVI